MRIASRFMGIVVSIAILGGTASASSPFDIILGRAPDIAVTDIHQESDHIYMRICNLGGSISDSSTSIGLAMKRTGGWVISSVEPIVMDNGDCHEFRGASVSELGITTSGTYEISAGAVLKEGRPESVKNNNKIVRSMEVIYPSKYSPTYNSSNYYNNNSGYHYNSNTAYGNSPTYYCLPGTTNCSTTPYNTNYNNYYCNASNNYCANNGYNGSYTYYRNNICPSWDYSCNYDYYNSTNTQYRNGNTYCTYSNNYCNGNSSYYSNNNSYYNSAYDLPDLVVQRIYQNSSDKNIIAQICNQGGDMRGGSVSFRTNFTANGVTANMYNSAQMSRGQCTSNVIYTTPGELDLIYSGNYSISVTVDAGNVINENNESNNTLAQSFFVETNRNQKSDLTVDRISANDNSRTIMTHVCNVGDDMLDYNNWTIEVSNTSNNSTIRNSGYRLYRGQCADITTSYASLGIYRSGTYNLRAVIDPDSAISEQSRWNNSLSQTVSVWMNY